MKILMISDYKAPIGGIEQFVQDASELLQTNNHKVTIVGLSLAPHILNRIRALLMPLTACNILFAIQLVYHIIITKPDLIWWHSVSRYVGWFPMWIASMFGIRTWMMYHDLGYFHPYPSLVTDVSQIPQHHDIGSRLLAGRAVGKSGTLNMFLIRIKFHSIQKIMMLLRLTATKHIVPSGFMVPIVQQRGIPADKIQVLAHFGRIN